MMARLYTYYDLLACFLDLPTKMCLNNPEKPCQQNGHCSGSCNIDTTVKPVRMDFGSVQWFKAVDYADLLRTHSYKKIRLLGANTGTG